MRKNNLLVTVACMLLVCLALAACSAKGQPIASQGAAASATPAPTAAPAPTPSPTPQPTPEPDTVFEERTPENPNLIGELISWVADERVVIIADEQNDVVAAGELYPTFAADFAAANQHYKNEEYDLAADGYTQILLNCPGHLGAMNNYALALMQKGDYEAGLKNIVLLATLHPDYYGVWPNFILGCYALGYDYNEVWNELRRAEIGMPDIGDFIYSVSKPEEDALYRAYTYNQIYSDMEMPLRIVVHDESLTQEMLDMQLASGEITEAEYNNTLLAQNYESWTYWLQLFNDYEHDPDIDALLAYAEGLNTIRTMEE